MRKKIVAGNWKMNTNLQEGIELAKAVAAKSVETPENVGLIVAAPFTHLCAVAEAVKGSKVEVSAQNCADHEKGAYTGEVSVGMLTSVGCQWTILGHSERRQYYGETDEKLVEKVKLALGAGLGVILCVGENLDEREAGKHFESEPARPQQLSRLRRFTLASARSCAASSARLSLKTPQSSTVEVASLPTPRNSSLRRTSTVA